MRLFNNKKSKYFLIAIIAVLAIGVIFTEEYKLSRTSVETSLEDVQKIVYETFSSLPNPVSPCSVYLSENSKITVNSFEYGNEKNIILDCSYSTLDIYSVIEQNLNSLFSEGYRLYNDNNKAGIKTNATKIKLYLSDKIKSLLTDAKIITGETQLELFETSDGKLELYLSDEAVNTVFGNIVNANKLIKDTTHIIFNGDEINISSIKTLSTGFYDCTKLINYVSRKPDTSTPIIKAFNSFAHEFNRNFLANDMWMYLAKGLLTTLEITLLAVIIGIVIGFLVAIVRCTNQKTGKLKVLSNICKLYLSIVRGTPVMVQLLIIYFVILLPIGIEKFPSAVICFGFNSGAYVSEIVRGGIMSIDAGQTEAGRSLGLTYMQTMRYIIIPQAFKAVLPSLANEFITLLKESSVAFYIGVADLTQGGLKIRSITYSNFMPLLAVAIIYLVVVLGLSRCVTLLERRMQKSDKR